MEISGVGFEMRHPLSSEATRSRISPAALLVKVTARIADGGHVFRRDEMRDAMSDDARFAAARACQDQQRPFRVATASRCCGLSPLRKSM